MKYSSTLPAFVLPFAILGAVQAQNPVSLLFSPKQGESTRSGSNGTVLGVLSERAVAVVTPGGKQCRYSAEKFQPNLALQTLVGDEDGDGDVYTPQLAKAIQALLVKPGKWDARGRRYVARTAAINVRDLYLTPMVAIGTNVSGAPGLRPCDSGRVVANGQIEHFIRGEHIIKAFGLHDANKNPLKPADLAIDAITMDSSDRIYLSFEEDHQYRIQCGGGYVTGTVRDGAVVVIPSAAWSRDLRGNVSNVLASSGRIVLTEARVDAMVLNSGLSGSALPCPVAAKDVDSLAIDHRGGDFVASACGQIAQFPNLLFTTETMTGAGVVSTVAGGQIAEANGCALAQSCAAGATNGEQMGLRATGKVGSLDALATVGRTPCRFTTGSPTPRGLGGVSEWHIGTNLNVPAVMFYAGNGGLPITPATNLQSALGLATDCFPDVFFPALANGPFVVPMVADGFGGRTGTFGPFALPVGVAPNGLIAQCVVMVNGKFQLSTPVTIID